MRMAALSWHLKWQARMRGARVRSDLRLARLARGDSRILVGPYLSEVGFELLYWIPMLRHWKHGHRIDPARLVAISRGGARPWYEGLCGSYLDVLDHFSVKELGAWQRRRVESAASQKQHLGPTQLDREIVRRARAELGDETFRTLHPSLMYRRFWRCFMGRSPLSTVTDRVEFSPLPRPALQPAEAIPGLPPEYVAVKAYTSSTLPATEGNRRAVVDLVRRLAETTAIVDLSTGLELDEHKGFGLPAGDGIFRAAEHMSPRNNLEVQTALVAGASALVSTYGGFSYLGPFLGVRSYPIYSAPAFNRAHLEVMRRASEDLGAGDFAPVRVEEIGRLEDALASAGSRKRSWDDPVSPRSR